MAAARGVMNSPSTEVPTLTASISATPRLHISTRLKDSVFNSTRSSIPVDSPVFSVPDWIRLMILYPPNMTTVTPRPTPAAIRNWGLESKAKTVGAADLNAERAAGAILRARLLISARVSATAAMASGFFWRWAIVAVAVCWTQ